MTVPKNGGIRAGVPRASALFLGTLGFTAVLVLGIVRREASMGILWPAAGAGAGAAALGYLAGRLAIAAISEGMAAGRGAPGGTRGAGRPAVRGRPARRGPREPAASRRPGLRARGARGTGRGAAAGPPRPEPGGASERK